jgi:hypothetical protein
MKKISFIWLFVLLVSYSYGQLNGDGFKTTVINKKVREFTLGIDLSTPLKSYLSREYVMVSGREGLWDEISTYQFSGIFDTLAPDKEVTEAYKDGVLDGVIAEMIVYKDSVAAILTYSERISGYLINLCRLEDEKWLNNGQDMDMTLENCRERIPQILNRSLAVLPVIKRLKRVPQNTHPFVDYLKKNGQAPADFLLGVLADHRIVVYGEYHRRGISWELLKRVIRQPAFTKTTGTVFMELPSRMQPVMDQFFEHKTIDKELLFRIFREEQPHGWWDKGEFEFLIELWKLNKSVKASERVKVILVDFQIPYSEIQNKEELEQSDEMDRNLNMANVIENHVRFSKDKRNHLFVVGCGHAYKSHVPGFASTPRGQKVELTAGAQLVERFSDKEVFVTFQHVVAGSNSGGSQRLIRDGLFDRVFEETGNAPVAFKLKGSPFGAEPFDGISEMKFNPLSGCYENNFDGYIFLQPLKEEMHDYILYEIFTDEFVEEMKRRAAYLGVPQDRPYWFGMKVEELTAEGIKKVLRDSSEGKKRYSEGIWGY